MVVTSDGACAPAPSIWFRDHIAAQPDTPQVLATNWVPGDGGPGEFYVAYGFEPTGEILGGEVLARLTL